MEKIIIAAVARNGVIGRSNGEMPWEVKEDFRHFKETTIGFPVIMGRKTFFSLGKPLSGRENIVITHQPALELPYPETYLVPSFQEALTMAAGFEKEKCYIIGGGEVYTQALPVADTMIISHMNFDAEGDVLFPQFSPETWGVVFRDPREQFEIVTYSRKHG